MLIKIRKPDELILTVGVERSVGQNAKLMLPRKFDYRQRIIVLLIDGPDLEKVQRQFDDREVGGRIYFVREIVKHLKAREFGGFARVGQSIGRNSKKLDPPAGNLCL